jgi:TetR/AcrR family transcriptional regulator, transcriptional repressor of bet genes
MTDVRTKQDVPRHAPKATERRHELIDAVLHILSTEGWDKLTVRRVAAQSRVSPGAMPHFLGTKAEMVNEAIRFGFRLYQDRLRRAIAGSRPAPTKLRDWLDATVSPTADTDAEWGFWLCMWGRVPFDESIRRDLAPVYRVHASAVEQVLLDGIADGTLRTEIEPRVLSDQLVALVDGLMLRCRLDPEFTPKRVRQIVEAFLDQTVVSSTG